MKNTTMWGLASRQVGAPSVRLRDGASSGAREGYSAVGRTAQGDPAEWCAVQGQELEGHASGGIAVPEGAVMTPAGTAAMPIGTAAMPIGTATAAERTLLVRTATFRTALAVGSAKAAAAPNQHLARGPSRDPV